MGETTVKVDDERFQRRLMDSAIRIGLLALLIAWCFNIVKPFIMPVLWGAIMAEGDNWHVVEPREITVLDRIGGGDGFVGSGDCRSPWWRCRPGDVGS